MDVLDMKQHGVLLRPCSLSRLQLSLLARIKQLNESGLITDADYDAKRQAILDEM
jgi:hypothetical protein